MLYKLVVSSLILHLLASTCIADESLSFMTLGDWGEPNDDQAGVASAMGDWASKNPMDFIVAVGDNFYEDGVDSVDDSQWQTTWTDVYDQYDSLKNLSWYAVLGNHDYHQNPEAQIEFSKTSQGRWIMDDHYYTRNFTFGSYSAKFIYIDTIWFGPEVSKHTKISNPDEKYNEQQSWLESELKSGTGFDWLLVFGHYPLFSRGDGDDETMQDAMQSLLEKYMVDAYICGHDHTMQHLSNNHVQYFVSANGSLLGKLKADSSAKVLFAKPEFAFASHQIQGKSMLVQFVAGPSGNVIYEYNQTARDRSSLSSPSVVTL